MLPWISSIPPIDLGERGGGGQEYAKKGSRCKMMCEFFHFFQDACGVFPDAWGLDWKMRFRGYFLEGLRLQKKGFWLHFYSVSLLSTEQHIFWYKTCKVWLDCEKQMENAIGLDFNTSCVWPKLGFTSCFTWFCAFFIKSVVCFAANLQQDKLQYFWPEKSPKMQPYK